MTAEQMTAEYDQMTAEYEQMTAEYEQMTADCPELRCEGTYGEAFGTFCTCNSNYNSWWNDLHSDSSCRGDGHESWMAHGLEGTEMLLHGIMKLT